jgi:hypothetical protein
MTVLDHGDSLKHESNRVCWNSEGFGREVNHTKGIAGFVSKVMMFHELVG